MKSFNKNINTNSKVSSRNLLYCACSYMYWLQREISFSKTSWILQSYRKLYSSCKSHWYVKHVGNGSLV